MSQNEIKIKVVLLGESGVGKTSIILRFINNIFSKNQVSTILATFSSKRISYNDNKDIILYNIWDTAGQEKFRSIAKINYKDAGVIILVFDITNQNSFENIKEYWYPEVKENAPEHAIIALVAAKCDLIEELEVNFEEVESYVKSINVIYKKTSSLTNKGIDELFEEIGKKILSFDNFEEMIFVRKDTTTIDDNDDQGSKATSNRQKSIAKVKNSKTRCC